MEPLLKIALAGELTIFTALAVKEKLSAALDAAQEIELDLSAISEMDSAGVQLLVAARRQAETRERRLLCLEPSAVVQDILALCNLGGLLADPVTRE